MNEDTAAIDINIWSEPFNFYENLTTTSKPTKDDSEAWYACEAESTSGSGSFSRLVHNTVRRAPDKSWSGGSPRHLTIRLNLHQFQTESGDSLGEDSERWARLQF